MRSGEVVRSGRELGATPLTMLLTWTLIFAWLRIAFARHANCSVVTVSSSAAASGQTHAIIAVRQLPPGKVAGRR